MFKLIRLLNTLSNELYNKNFEELPDGQTWNVIDLTSNLFNRKILKVNILINELTKSKE